MKVVAAYLLAQLGGNFYPKKEDLKAILASVGADADDEKIEYLLKQVKGKSLDDLIEVGREIMASNAPAAAGGGYAVSAAAPAGGAGGDAAPAAEEKKEEKKEESDDEESFFDLFE